MDNTLQYFDEVNFSSEENVNKTLSMSEKRKIKKLKKLSTMDSLRLERVSYEDRLNLDCLLDSHATLIGAGSGLLLDITYYIMVIMVVQSTAEALGESVEEGFRNHRE